ncbi:unnamed protein product, partial [Prorocentrum cordatum]
AARRTSWGTPGSSAAPPACRAHGATGRGRCAGRGGAALARRRRRPEPGHAGALQPRGARAGRFCRPRDPLRPRGAVGGTFSAGDPLDLLIVTAEAGDYTPFNVSENTHSGRGGEVGSVSQKCGGRSSLVFRLVGANTSAPEVAEDFLATFFFVDRRLQVQVHGFDDYFVSSDSLLKVVRISHGGLWARTSGFSTWAMSPTNLSLRDPTNLSQDEQHLALTLLFRGASEFRVDVAVTGPREDDGVDLVFAGAPLQLFCPGGSRRGRQDQDDAPSTPRRCREVAAHTGTGLSLGRRAPSGVAARLGGTAAGQDSRDPVLPPLRAQQS